MKKYYLVGVGIIGFLVIDFYLDSILPANLLSLNTGIGLGMASGLANFWLIILQVAVLLFLVIFFSKYQKQLFGHGRDIGLVMVIAGAVSNILDRFLYAGVLDYINFFGLFSNNLADIFIFLGLVLLFFNINSKGKKEKNEN